MKKLATVFLLLPFFTACSLTEPRDVGKANMLTLHATAQPQEVKQKHGTLSIQLPEAPLVLDTYRIAVTLADGRDDYIAGARWNTFLTSLVQESLRDNFAQSHVFTHTNEDTDVGESKYQLRTEIRSFSAVYTVDNQPPIIKVKLGFTVKRGYTQVVKQFSSAAEVAASANSITAIHAAFDQAFNQASADALEKVSAATK